MIAILTLTVMTKMFKTKQTSDLEELKKLAVTLLVSTQNFPDLSVTTTMVENGKKLTLESSQETTILLMISQLILSLEW